jgi:glycosyltransferase involved in cell wall biosynthesis
MKISYFNCHHDISGQTQGAAVQIRALAQVLEKLGHRVDVRFLAAYKQGETGAPPSLKEIRWLRRYGHVPRLLLRNISLIRRELRYLKDFQPDVVLAVSSYCTISTALAARWLHLPLVLFCEAPLEYEYSLFLRKYYPYPLLGRWLEGFSIRRARRVSCISEVLKGYLMRYGAPAAKFQVIPNGVDHRAIRPGPPDPDLHAHLQLQDKIVIGFVGSFQFFSHLEGFIDLTRSLCQQFPKLVFLFVGESDAAAALRQFSRAEGLEQQFLFTGTVAHAAVPRYLSLMDIVISPYRGDYLFYGSSMKLLEYMAAGKPVLATALGQIKELIQDGVNGMLNDPDDWASMARKLAILINDRQLRHQLGAKARRTIEQGWTWDHQGQRLAKLLAQAISTP